VIARLKLWAAAIGVFVTGAAAIWLAGRKSAQSDAEVKELEGYVKTRKRMDAADDGIVGDDPASARRWLHERGKP
jgi:hypothetical protein